MLGLTGRAVNSPKTFQVQNWIGEMESILTTNDVAKNYYYGNYHDYPDILCGSTLTPDPSLKSSKAKQSGDKDQVVGVRCSASEFWFTDQFCTSVVKDPEMDCYPTDSW